MPHDVSDSPFSTRGVSADDSADDSAMKAKLELLQMLAESEADIRQGRVFPSEDVFREVRATLEEIRRA